MWPFKKAVRTDSTKTLMLPAPSVRADGWRSALSGLGNTSYDPRTAVTFTYESLNSYEAMDLWRGDPIAARIIETRPNEMLRQGWHLTIDKDTNDLAKRVVSMAEDVLLNENLWMGLCYENAYGGGAVFFGSNDLQELGFPLDIRNVQNLGYLQTFEPKELQPVRWQRDITQADFGRPTHYRLHVNTPGGGSQQGVIIHASRLMVFPGIRVSRDQLTTNFGWGDARLGRSRAVLRDFNVSWSSAAVLLNDFSTAVYKIKGLAEAIAFDKDKEITDRIRAMKLSQGILRATLLDADSEDYERKQTPLTGMPEMLDRFATHLAASADMPVTLLMGQSPSGLNATGESDIRFFYDRIKSDQGLKLRRPIEQFCRVAFAALGENEPEHWEITFAPLWQPTEKEQAETRLVQAQVDQIEISNQVVSPEEVRDSRHGHSTYSTTTVISGPAPEAPVLEAAPILRTTEAPVDPEPVKTEVPVKVKTPEPVKVPETKTPETPDAPVVPEAPMALNGAQVASLVDIVKATVNREIPRASAIQIISLAFNISAERAVTLLGPEDFSPAAPTPPVVA